MEFNKIAGNVLVYDWETTGLSSTSDKPIQGAFILCNVSEGKWTEIETYNTYINPEMEIDPQASEVTGITNEFLEDKPKEEEVFPKIYELFKKADFICGHNIDTFDNKFTAALFARNGHPGEFDFTDRSIDTLKASRQLVKREDAYNKSHKLENMLKYYGLEVEGSFHDALTDVRSCIVLAEKLQEEFAKIPEETQEELEDDKIKVVVYSVNPWIGKFPGAYIKANYLFVNTNCGKFRFNRYNYRWDKVETFKPCAMKNVIAATYEFCGVDNEGDLAHWTKEE